MPSLKSSLYILANIVGVSPAALYERQRALVKLGILTAAPGRGPGSGVPLTPDSVAVMVICLLAAETLGDVDQRIAAICEAVHDPDVKIGQPTFRSEVAGVLSGQAPFSTSSRTYSGIRVSRCWRGQIIRGTHNLQSADFHVAGLRPYSGISVSADIEGPILSKLIAFTTYGMEAKSIADSAPIFEPWENPATPRKADQ